MRIYLSIISNETRCVRRIIIKLILLEYDIRIINIRGRSATIHIPITLNDPSSKQRHLITIIQILIQTSH